MANKKHVAPFKTKSGYTLYKSSMAYLMSLGHDGGFCVNCGSDTDGVEPDAEGYVCPHCGLQAVYGREAIVLMGFTF